MLKINHMRSKCTQEIEFRIKFNGRRDSELPDDVKILLKSDSKHVLRLNRKCKGRIFEAAGVKQSRKFLIAK